MSRPPVLVAVPAPLPPRPPSCAGATRQRPRHGRARPGPARGSREGRTDERRSPVFEINLEQAAVAAEEALDVLLPDVVAQAADIDARHVRGRGGGGRRGRRGKERKGKEEKKERGRKRDREGARELST